MAASSSSSSHPLSTDISPSSSSTTSPSPTPRSTRPRNPHLSYLPPPPPYLESLSPHTKNIIAGGGAGLLSSTIVCPLDVVKTRLQNDPGRQRVTPWGGLKMLRSIWIQEGFKGLYRGLSPTILSYLPSWAIYFTVYDGCKRFAMERQHQTVEGPLVHMGSALLAGILSTTAICPLWVIRTRIMTQPAHPTPTHPYYYTSVGNGISSIIKNEGFRGLYKGLGPSLLGVSHVMVQFPLYEFLKKVGMEYEEKRRLLPLSPIPNSSSSSNNNNRHIPTHIVLISTTLSKMIASFMTYPHEVIRTRLQTTTFRKESKKKGGINSTSTSGSSPSRSIPSSTTSPTLQQSQQVRTVSTSTSNPPQPSASIPSPQQQQQQILQQQHSKYRGIFQTATLILKEEGLRGWYKGFATNLFRTIPSSLITFWTYEVLREYLRIE